MPKPVVELEPFAVRPKDGRRLAGCGETEFYKRMNEGRYETSYNTLLLLAFFEECHSANLSQ